MSRLSRNGTAEPVSQDQILRHEPGQGNIHSSCSADRVQDWQPYPVDPYSCNMLLLLLFLTFNALVANPKKLLYIVANPARGLLNRGKKKKSGSAPLPPSPPPCPQRAACSEKKKKKITRRILMSRRYASWRYAGGLGPSRVCTRIPTSRQLCVTFMYIMNRSPRLLLLLSYSSHYLTDRASTIHPVIYGSSVGNLVTF